MQVLGVRHSLDDPLFPAVISYLDRIDWNGKTVAIEETNKRYRTGRNFWQAITHHIESRGGKVVHVDNIELVNWQSRMHARFNKHGDPASLFAERKTNLLRTVTMIEKSKLAGASMLITGVAHAYDVKKLLGKRANVRIIARPNSMRRYGYYSETIRDMRKKFPTQLREFIQRIASAIREKEKMKRPRLQPKNRKKINQRK